MNHAFALCICVMFFLPMTEVNAKVIVTQLGRESPSSRAATAKPTTATEILKQLRASRSQLHKPTPPSTPSGKKTSQIKLDFIPPADRRERAAQGYGRLSAPSGTYGVEGHGTPSSMTCRNGRTLSARELAAWIKNDPRYRPGMTVYLLACETGKGGQPFAQSLSNQLAAAVVAPTEKLWVHQDGDYSVAAGRPHKLLGIFSNGGEHMDSRKPGFMKTFRPQSSTASRRTASTPARFAFWRTASERNARWRL